VGDFLAVFLEVGGQVLVVGAAQVALLPAGLREFDGTVADVFAVHFLEGVEEVVGVAER
jgi:hypothetical protein